MAYETTAETDTTEDGWVRADDGSLIPDYDATIPVINEGEVVRGTVVRVDKDEVLVDIGYKSEGVIPVSELSIRRSVNPADEVQLGDEIDALVMTKEDAEGRLILSKKRARFEMAWKRIEGAAESGEPVEGTVIEVVKGGLILDLGVRGFLPASLVDIRRVQNLDEFLGKQLRSKVIELNRSRNNVVLSRRAVLEDERKEMRQAILDRLSPGDVVEGTISNIVDFGAFVDLEGIDGLIHISELSWSHVNHPSEVLEIGQTVRVKVLDIDRDRQRISLGLKQTQSDPWQQVIDAYQESDVVEGRVTKVVTFGAFVEILPGVEGLVHISELAQHHVENPREIVSQGEVVKVKIIEMDADRRRLSLSLKRVEETDDVRPSIGGLARSALRRGEPEAPRLEAEARRLEPSRRRREVEPAADEAEWSSRRASRGEDARRRGCGGGRSSSGRSSPRPAVTSCDEEPPSAEAVRRGSPGRRPSPSPPRAEASPSRADERRRRPVAVAITGGIGAGKSTALRAFARHGAAVISSDEIVHQLLREDPEVKRAVIERFGEERARRRRRDRPAAVGKIVFADRPELAWLEQLLHPRVVARLPALARGARRAPDPPAVCVTEVPLLYEVGGETRFDKVVVVTASPEVRIARRSGRSREREQRLIPDEEKIARADFVYVNDGTLDDLDEFVVRRGGQLSVMRFAVAASSLLAALAVGFFYVEDTKPAWYARLRYPLEYEHIVRGHARQLRARSGAARGGHLPGEQVRRRTRARRRARSGSCSSCPTRRRASPSYTGGNSSRSTTSTTRRSTSATAPSTCAGCSRSTTTSALALAAYNAGQTNVDSGSPRGRGDPLPRDAGVRRQRARAAK